MANTFNLKDCPFCGKKAPIVAVRSAREMGLDDDAENWNDADKAANCDILQGGCGACGGWNKDAEKCRRSWNNRVNLIPPVTLKTRFPKKWTVKIGSEQFAGNLEDIHTLLNALSLLTPVNGTYRQQRGFVVERSYTPEIKLREEEYLTLCQEEVLIALDAQDADKKGDSDG